VSDVAITIPMSEWHRLIDDLEILGEAYNDLLKAVSFLFLQLEHRGVCDGLVYDELNDILSWAHLNQMEVCN
jgi:hypothetical protein